MQHKCTSQEYRNGVCNDSTVAQGQGELIALMGAHPGWLFLPCDTNWARTITCDLWHGCGNGHYQSHISRKTIMLQRVNEAPKAFLHLSQGAKGRFKQILQMLQLGKLVFLDSNHFRQILCHDNHTFSKPSTLIHFHCAFQSGWPMWMHCRALVSDWLRDFSESNAYKGTGPYFTTDLT